MRTTKHLPTLFWTLLLAVMAACQDAMVEPPHVRDVAVATQGLEADVITDPILRLFDLDVAVAGELRPGMPVEVTATATGLWPAPDVELRIAVPEAEAARRTSWGADFRVPTGQPLPAVSTARTSLSTGQRSVQSGTFIPEAAGYYRVAVSAHAPPESVRDPRGQLVEDAAVEEVWVLIQEEGGLVTDAFDPTVLPDSVLPAPGPFRYRSRSGTADATASTSARTPGTRTWEVVYWNSDSSRYDPLVGAAVSGEEGIAPGPYSPVSDVTDNDGEFVTGCDHDLVYWWDMEVKAQNILFYVVPSTTVATQSGISPSGCSPQQLVALSNQSHLFTNARIAATAGLTIFDKGTSDLVISYDPSAGTSKYFRFSDSAVVNGIWGANMAEAVAHEYGHGLHDTALGGVTFGSECANHAIPEYSDHQCAYAEGFAEFFAAVTRGPGLSILYADFESGAFLLSNPNDDESDPNDPNGSILEGAVAAFLLDMLDGANEPHDSISYPGSYIADLISTCQVNFGSGLQDADGIDMFIRCAEKSVDSGVTTYFYPRDTDPTAYSESATEPGSWSMSKIRVNWLKNLYNQ